MRLQTQPPPAPGQLPKYAGLWDCAKKTVINEVGWCNEVSYAFGLDHTVNGKTGNHCAKGLGHSCSYVRMNV